MSNSTEWHKHKDGEWHRHHKAFYSTCDTTGFYDTFLSKPFKAKSMLKVEAGGRGSRGGRLL